MNYLFKVFKFSNQKSSRQI